MKTSLFICAFIITSNAFAHGEDKYGPNKGYIQMPGSFHTELVPQMDGSFMVFLLDLQNRNPAVKDSSVQMRIKNKKKIVALNCKPMNDHFWCSNNKKLDLASEGQVIIKSRRLGIEAKEAIYEWPLKLKGEKDSDDMKGHNMKDM